MKLKIYKGFNKEFLATIDRNPLVDGKLEDKLNVLKFDKKLRKKLDMALLSLDDEEEVWVTYEEYTLIKNRVDDAVHEDGLKLEIFRNNMFPDYYPLSFEISDELAGEIIKNINTDTIDDVSEECKCYLAVYNTLVRVDEQYYGSFYNYEYDKDVDVENKAYYPENIEIEDSRDTSAL